MHKKEKKDEFLKIYWATMGKITKACIATKVSRATFYNWLDPKQKEYDEQFSDAIKMADLSFIEMCEEQVWKKIESGSDLWLWRYLRNHAPERWKMDNQESSQVHSGVVKLEIDRKII